MLDVIYIGGKTRYKVVQILLHMCRQLLRCVLDKPTKHMYKTYATPM